ncbi:MAG: hypothetical protein IT193_06060 [Propionibacteriaceae bacterium]|nr:hypothetical protein [Propionibacteriaceae bacterium]
MARMNCCPPRAEAPTCPIIDAPTKPVSLVTVGQHVVLRELPATTFGFCDAPNCDVVYVGADGTLIRKDQLRTRVGVKEQDDPIPVCYCFDFSARQISDDFMAHGRSTIRAYIEEQVRAERCRCELTNPTGRCCLGNVHRVIIDQRA